MKNIDFDFIYSELEKIRDEIVEKYMAIYRSRDNSQRIPIYQGDIFGNRIGNAVDYLNDVCGIAWIGFKDRRSSFFKQYKAYLKKKNGGSKWLDVHLFSHPYSGRQELEVNKAVADACCDYINKNFGANCFSRSRIN